MDGKSVMKHVFGGMSFEGMAGPGTLARTRTHALLPARTHIYTHACLVAFAQDGDNLHPWVAVNPQQCTTELDGSCLKPGIFFDLSQDMALLSGDNDSRADALVPIVWAGGQRVPPPDYAPNDCRPGYFYTKTAANNKAFSCEACRAGTFVNTASALKCEDCPIGEITKPTGGASSCTACGPGMFHPDVSKNVCLKCDILGFYWQDKPGKTMCTKCPLHTQLRYNAEAQSISDCVCSNGHFLHEESLLSHGCEDCTVSLPGTSPGTSAARCLGSELDGRLLAPVATAGFYMLRMRVSAHETRYLAHKCLPAARCLAVSVHPPSQTNVTAIVVGEDLPMKELHSSALTKCKMNFRGFLCSECYEGMMRWLGSAADCHECPGFLIKNLWLGKLVSVVLIAVVLFCWIPLLRYVNQRLPTLYSVQPLAPFILCGPPSFGVCIPECATLPMLRDVPPLTQHWVCRYFHFYRYLL